MILKKLTTEFYEKNLKKYPKRLTLKGNIVIFIGLFVHLGNNEVWENIGKKTLAKTKEMLDDMHKKRIDMTDETFRWIY